MRQKNSAGVTKDSNDPIKNLKYQRRVKSAEKFEKLMESLQLVATKELKEATSVVN